MSKVIEIQEKILMLNRAEVHHHQHRARSAAVDACVQQWLDRARVGPVHKRQPWYLNGQLVGSVPQGLLARLDARALAMQGVGVELSDSVGVDAQTVWHVKIAPESVDEGLAHLACALRALGCCGAWRNELVDVWADDHFTQQSIAGRIERATVRVLGLRTQAVHLIGWNSAREAMWVQQRALNKATFPGLWDTLMGGLVASRESLALTLERETWEEAGLHLSALHALQTGGYLDSSCPMGAGMENGHMRERMHWFECIVPEGCVPVNQDGEVQQFVLMDIATLEHHLVQEAFTLEASLMIAVACGWLDDTQGLVHRHTPDVLR